MSSKNDCRFYGRIAGDIKTTTQTDAQGNSYTKCSFSFAVENYLTQAQKQANQNAGNNPKPWPEASFILITASGKVAERVVQYCCKGKPILITTEMFTFTKQGDQNPTVGFKMLDFAFSLTDNTGNQNQGNNQGYQNNQGNNQGYQNNQGGYQQPQGGYQQPQGGYQQPQGGYQQPPQGGQPPQGQQRPQGQAQGGYNQAPPAANQPAGNYQGTGAVGEFTYSADDEDIPF